MPGLLKPEHPFLKEIVRFIAYLEFPAELAGQYLCLFPNCTTNLSITLEGPVITGNGQALSNFAGTSCLSPMVFDRSRSIRILDIQFEPFGLHALLGRPMDEYTNRVPPLDVLFRPSDLEVLYNRAIDAADFSEVVQAVELFLLNAWQHREPDARITAGVRRLQSLASPDMDTLGNDLCLSSRGLRKLFKRNLGISPKYFANLMRFNRAARRINGDADSSLTAIALDQGYYDQAHFIREFRKFAGITPNDFRRLPGKSAEFYNFIPEGPITFGMS